MVKNKFCVLFSGAIGSSKTPIAIFLSEETGLPVFNNDSIRTEVLEDFRGSGEISKIERELAYDFRRDERLNEVLKRGESFILDASIDRRWNILKAELEFHEYKWFIISLDLGKKLLLKLYKAKGYIISDSLDKTIEDHNLFIKKHKKEVGLHISDKSFRNRMKLSIEALKKWENSLEH